MDNKQTLTTLNILKLIDKCTIKVSQKASLPGEVITKE